MCTPAVSATAPKVSGLPVITAETPGASVAPVDVSVPAQETPAVDSIEVYTIDPVATPGVSYDIYAAAEFTDQDGTATIMIKRRANVNVN